jgi:hypothetical protein
MKSDDFPAQARERLRALGTRSGKVSKKKRFLFRRLAEAGKDGPPPAYKFLPSGPGETQKAATADACANMENSGYMEPSDWKNPHPGPPRPPAPPSPPGPGGPISKAECDRAGGILDKHAIACCPKSCGVCGGSDCGGHPGGDANCCSHKVAGNGRDCATKPAPCGNGEA